MKRLFYLVLAAVFLAPVLRSQGGTADDTRIQAAVHKTLKGRSFRELQSSVQDAVVTLHGSVDLYSAKRDALQRVSRIRGIQAIRDEVQIVSPVIPDQRLQAELEKKLRIEGHRVYVQVNNGVVTLGGYADRSFHIFAVATIGRTPGVKGLHDVLEPGRSSPLDSIWPTAAPAIGGVSGP